MNYSELARQILLIFLAIADDFNRQFFLGTIVVNIFQKLVASLYNFFLILQSCNGFNIP